MTPLEVRIFDGQTSQAVTGRLWLDESGTLHLEAGGGHRFFALAEVEISQPLGRTPRSFRFPDGSMAECTDHRAVAQMLSRHQAVGTMDWLHVLESRYSAVIAALLLTVLVSWGFIQYGVPWLAQRLAFAMPPSLDQSISEQSLALMDRGLLQPSELTPATRRRLTARFEQMAAGLNDRHQFQLLFRKSPVIGANAFALPSGTVVMTDELVALASNDHELSAVLAHELGHVVQRHGLRSVLQDSAVVLVVATVTGDIGTAGGLAAAIPVLLAESKFSRDFELEADRFARAQMLRHRIPLSAFPDLLQRLSEAHGETDGESGFFDSHPASAQRALLFADP